ncbi:interleukin-11 receptor subunit alpha-like [Pollicipes pollicipes]|uniref:interleukin-11 receptor subunit alpha-like n=1 Tax=Pollicipes pollicipes TaxID=41117 RepID=UPI00188561F5|nr:interleukin-11 receptor subunit alpha-like [Pollicipes pollicipes]XP_037092861.1 interleukin-11 receptor subunit alpha-like [Pollicipes pollicipes]XP_037092862.1 interleukin-11 receptor subunit alpha-like [Pollicipes pollicipes]XP_037092863.1 interleukin-11 receptor subunit alpha-like [Pollicipes pollicipes]
MLPVLLLSAFYYNAAAAGHSAPHFYGDPAENVSLPCPGWTGGDAVWVRDGRALADAAPAPGGHLLVRNASADDEGLYGCAPHADAAPSDIFYVHLLLRRLPGPLANVRVRAHTVLAELFWHANDTGALPLSRIGLRYRAKDGAHWKQPIPPHVAPSEAHRELYGLRPNTTYEFQLWAENRLGPGPNVTVRATTRADLSRSDVARGLVAEALVLGSESWVAAVVGSLVVVLLVAVGGACFVYRSQRVVPANGDSTEGMELVSNLQQPGYELEVLEQDENSNSQRAHLLNNNVEVHPVRI